MKINKLICFILSFTLSIQSFANEVPVEPIRPVNQCSGLNGAPYTACTEAFNQQMAAYDQELRAYQEYMAGQPTTNQIQSASATKVLEDITAKQNDAATKMSGTSSMLTSIGTALIAAGGSLILAGMTMISSGTAMLSNPLTVAAGNALIAKGGLFKKVGIALIAAGGVMIVYGLVTRGKSNKLAQGAYTTCQQYNQLAVKPLDCPAAQQQSGDGVITVSTSGTGAVPAFIDPVTGLCRPGAPIECKSIIKDLPAGCFQKGGACLAGGKGPPQKIIAKDGKVTMDLNGSKRTFGLEDFSSEAAMIKAGFSPSQAKQFYSDLNSAEGILAKNGLNAKGELKGMITNTMSGAGAAVAPAASSGAASVMKIDRDKYGPAVREPASAEGLTKDYHGDTIGADGDDVFKMINRRYRVKKLQNIFIEE